MQRQPRFMQDLVEHLRVAPGRTVRLRRDFDPDYTYGFSSRAEAEAHLTEGISVLAEYQDRLSAQKTFGVLLLLQGIDAAGKDSTIKHVMSGVNPQGVEVHSFKEPTPDELSHDFLWRYQLRVPDRGRIGIFNRSHYEEVLVVRVHPDLLAAQRLPGDAATADIWKRRYREINDWERYLVVNGIRIVKVFLNLSKQEQAARFLRRIDHPEKNWKFSPADIRERKYWDDYQLAFDDMLSQTSSTWAPWHVVPADHKWFSQLATAAILVDTITDIDPQYPQVSPEFLKDMAKARAELLADTK